MYMHMHAHRRIYLCMSHTCINMYTLRSSFSTFWCQQFVRGNGHARSCKNRHHLPEFHSSKKTLVFQNNSSSTLMCQKDINI